MKLQQMWVLLLVGSLMIAMAPVEAEMVVVQEGSAQLKKQDGKISTLTGSVIAWIGWRMHRAKENRDRTAAVVGAVVAIEKLGGEVTSEYEEMRPPTWLERQFDDPGDADDPVGVLKVTDVDLGLTKVTDAGLKHLKGLKSLRSLNLQGTKVTDAGVKKLQQALPQCQIYKN